MLGRSFVLGHWCFFSFWIVKGPADFALRTGWYIMSKGFEAFSNVWLYYFVSALSAQTVWRSQLLKFVATPCGPKITKAFSFKEVVFKTLLVQPLRSFAAQWFAAWHPFDQRALHRSEAGAFLSCSEAKSQSHEIHEAKERCFLS